MKAWHRQTSVAAMAASSATAWGYNYGGIYFFGDSLTDAGAFTVWSGRRQPVYPPTRGPSGRKNLGDRYGWL